MRHFTLYIICIIAFLSGCQVKPSVPAWKKLYCDIWVDSDTVLHHLKDIQVSELSDMDRHLYMLTYSLAAYRSGVSNPYTDLSSTLEYLSTLRRKDYLFVAFVHQSHLLLLTNQYKSSLEYLQYATPIYDSRFPSRSLSQYHSLYGYLMAHVGDYPSAIQHYEASQAINRKEEYVEWTVSNAINLINLPGYLSPDTLSQFIRHYEPYLCQVSPDRRRKFYNNIGNEFKYSGDSTNALLYYKKALDADNSADAVISRLNYAQLLESAGHYQTADSLYSHIMMTSDSLVLNRLYHHRLSEAVKRQDIAMATRYMNIYIESLHHLYATRDRQELLEMQAKYDRSELLRLSEENRNTVLQVLLFVCLSLIVSYIIYVATQLYDYHRLARYLNQFCQLTKKYRQSCKYLTDYKDELSVLEHLYHKDIQSLTEKISHLLKERNRFRAIYHIHTSFITLTPEDVSALNFYLEFSRGKIRYQASRHRSTLYHWLNLVDNRFVERFTSQYPQLTPHDLDLCCFYRCGFDNDQISGFYGQYSDSIRRHRLRLYPILGVCDKESFDHFIQTF